MVDFLRKAAKPTHVCIGYLFFVMMTYVFFFFNFPSGMSCSKDMFSCADGGCVSWTLTCNGEKSCEDGTHEPSVCKIFLGTKLSDFSLCKKEQQAKHTSANEYTKFVQFVLMR